MNKLINIFDFFFDKQCLIIIFSFVDILYFKIFIKIKAKFIEIY